MRKGILFCILVLAPLVFAEKIAVLPEVGKPSMMALDADRLYVTEGATIYVYSRPDYKLVRRFGTSGEGPREFKVSPFGVPLFVDAQKDGVFISSDSKISRFTRDGEFIREERVPPMMVYRPFSGGYVATAAEGTDDGRMVLSVNLYDESFQKKKTLYRSDVEVGPNASFDYPMNSFSYEMVEDRIFVVAGKDGFALEVFDARGEKLYRIEKKTERIPVTAEYKKKTLDWFKNDPNWGRLWEYFRNRFHFKDYFPPIQDIAVEKGRIYVLTHRRDKENAEIQVLDLKGKQLGRHWIPLPRVYGMDFMPKYRIFNSRIFVLQENEDEEEWELHAYSLK